MRAVSKLAKPDEAEVEITLTATAEEWKRVAALLNEAREWPGWQIAAMIGNAVRGLTAHTERVVEDER